MLQHVLTKAEDTAAVREALVSFGLGKKPGNEILEMVLALAEATGQIWASAVTMIVKCSRLQISTARLLHVFTTTEDSFVSNIVNGPAKYKERALMSH